MPQFTWHFRRLVSHFFKLLFSSLDLKWITPFSTKEFKSICFQFQYWVLFKLAFFIECILPKLFKLIRPFGKVGPSRQLLDLNSDSYKGYSTAICWENYLYDNIYKTKCEAFLTKSLLVSTFYRIRSTFVISNVYWNQDNVTCPRVNSNDSWLVMLFVNIEKCGCVQTIYFMRWLWCLYYENTFLDK